MRDGPRARRARSRAGKRCVALTPRFAQTLTTLGPALADANARHYPRRSRTLRGVAVDELGLLGTLSGDSRAIGLSPGRRSESARASQLVLGDVGTDPPRWVSWAVLLVHGTWHGGVVLVGGPGTSRSAGHRLDRGRRSTGIGERDSMKRPRTSVWTLTCPTSSMRSARRTCRVCSSGTATGRSRCGGAAALVPDRVGELIDLDGFLPQVGQCVFDMLPPLRSAGSNG